MPSASLEPEHLPKLTIDVREDEHEVPTSRLQGIGQDARADESIGICPAPRFSEKKLRDHPPSNRGAQPNTSQLRFPRGLRARPGERLADSGPTSLVDMVTDDSECGPVPGPESVRDDLSDGPLSVAI